MPYGNEYEVQKRLPGERFYRVVESFSSASMADALAQTQKNLHPENEYRINSHMGYKVIGK